VALGVSARTYPQHLIGYGINTNKARLLVHASRMMPPCSD
jgi:hypothetical protein